MLLTLISLVPEIGFKNRPGVFLQPPLLFALLIPQDLGVIVKHTEQTSVASADQPEHQEHLSHTGLYLLHVSWAKGSMSNYYKIKQSKLTYLKIRHILSNLQLNLLDSSTVKYHMVIRGLFLFFRNAERE